MVFFGVAKGSQMDVWVWWKVVAGFEQLCSYYNQLQSKNFSAIDKVASIRHVNQLNATNLRGEFRKKNGKMSDIEQKGGRGLSQNPSF